MSTWFDRADAVAPVRRRLGPAALACATLGALLLVWSIRAAGAYAVFAGARRLGAGFVVVLALGGVRHLMRTLAWLLCLDRQDRPTVAETFGAYISGDSIGNVTPFGFLISEPSKIVLLRARVPPRVSIAALAIENILYSGTVVLMLVAGTAALLLSFPVPHAVRTAALATLAGAVVSGLVATVVIVTRTPLLATLGRLVMRLGMGRAFIEPRLHHVEEIEMRILGFASAHPGLLAPILALELTFHAAGVLEIWFALGLITGTWPSPLTAFVLEYVNRTITVIFQFVPMWLGVDEAGTGIATATLGLGPAAGVTLAIVRKARVATWTIVGLVLLLHRGLSLRSAVREAEVIAAQR